MPKFEHAKSDKLFAWKRYQLSKDTIRWVAFAVMGISQVRPTTKVEYTSHPVAYWHSGHVGVEPVEFRLQQYQIGDTAIALAYNPYADVIYFFGYAPEGD